MPNAVEAAMARPTQAVASSSSEKPAATLQAARSSLELLADTAAMARPETSAPIALGDAVIISRQSALFVTDEKFQRAVVMAQVEGGDDVIRAAADDLLRNLKEVVANGDRSSDDLAYSVERQGLHSFHRVARPRQSGHRPVPRSQSRLEGEPKGSGNHLQVDTSI